MNAGALDMRPEGAITRSRPRSEVGHARTTTRVRMPDLGFVHAIRGQFFTSRTRPCPVGASLTQSNS
ncbi:hypothetical protein D7S86_18220 [Pararobbsia silviterrae]|uniref:Uncharacterized protein n=1 Tax=Pararobbsia silviterrae TaxID=1792498 RepID=A0A494XMF5_9BURK|nr:hypothetical protein D7S86_18220 [Pararobbsia silviterrae]